MELREPVGCVIRDKTEDFDTPGRVILIIIKGTNIMDVYRE